MPPIRSRTNQYYGINAHLHSLWQKEGGWSDFHAAHIGDLSKALKSQLLPMGYTTEIEPSLQIRRSNATTGRPQSDVTIYDLLPLRPTHLPPLLVGVGEVVLPLPLMLENTSISEKPFRSVAIYPASYGKRDRSKPVAWVELLSPANKGESEDAEIYTIKRQEILENGIVFVEIDYLHETPPTFARLANYSARTSSNQQTTAHPYRIVMLDPRPTLQSGEAHVREFDVDSPLPTMTIPLNAGDMLSFDFGVPYRKTFEEGLYGLELVDYQELPVNFKRYRPVDQERIAARILAILQAIQQGADLETGPFPAKMMPLPEALAEIKTLRTLLV